jgi:signal-transduction protein with cAMP-binding, CBS, and nucleotidyltransferase domain
MPVVDKDGFMIGIVSEADLIARTIGGQAKGASDPSRNQRVVDVMTRNVVSVNEDTELAQVADLMTRHKIKRVPVLRGKSVVGVVSRIDLLRGLISSTPGQLETTARSTDDELRRAVVAALRGQSWSRAMRLDVAVSHRVVHLWGMVPSEQVRLAYADAAAKVPGIAKVQSHMHVRR